MDDLPRRVPALPTHQHESVESARTEAERLVRMTGRKAYLLEVVADCSADLPTEAPVRWRLSDKAIVAVTAGAK